jgi:hypothetical protein
VDGTMASGKTQNPATDFIIGFSMDGIRAEVLNGFDGTSRNHPKIKQAFDGADARND